MRQGPNGVFEPQREVARIAGPLEVNCWRVVAMGGVAGITCCEVGALIQDGRSAQGPGEQRGQ